MITTTRDLSSPPTLNNQNRYSVLTKKQQKQQKISQSNNNNQHHQQQSGHHWNQNPLLNQHNTSSSSLGAKSSSPSPPPVNVYASNTTSQHSASKPTNANHNPIALNDSNYPSLGGGSQKKSRSQKKKSLAAAVKDYKSVVLKSTPKPTPPPTIVSPPSNTTPSSSSTSSSSPQNNPTKNSSKKSKKKQQQQQAKSKKQQKKPTFQITQLPNEELKQQKKKTTSKQPSGSTTAAKQQPQPENNSLSGSSSNTSPATNASSQHISSQHEESWSSLSLNQSASPLSMNALSPSYMNTQQQQFTHQQQQQQQHRNSSLYGSGGTSHASSLSSLSGFGAPMNNGGQNSGNFLKSSPQYSSPGANLYSSPSVPTTANGFLGGGIQQQQQQQHQSTYPYQSFSAQQQQQHQTPNSHLFSSQQQQHQFNSTGGLLQPPSNTFSSSSSPVSGIWSGPQQQQQQRTPPLSRYAQKFTPTSYLYYLFKELSVHPPKTQSELMWERLLQDIPEYYFTPQFLKEDLEQYKVSAPLSKQNYKYYFFYCILSEFDQRRKNRLRYESLLDIPFCPRATVLKKLEQEKGTLKQPPIFFAVRRNAPELILEVTVPGLSEGRPRLYKDNLVRIQLCKENEYHEWVGRVISVDRQSTVLVGGVSESILEYYDDSSSKKKSKKKASNSQHRFHISFPLDHLHERILLYVLHTMNVEFIDLLFSRSYYNREMLSEKGLSLLDNHEEEGSSSSQKSPSALLEKTPNHEQRQFCAAVLKPNPSVRNQITLLWGPAGTGKTSATSAAVMHILSTYPDRAKILLSAPSHSAADHITRVLSARLSNQKMYRLYSPDRDVSYIPQELKAYTTITSNMQHGFPVAQVGLPQGGVQELSKYQVVVCTCQDAIYLKLLGMPYDHFTHLFMDEAAQATEVESLIPMMFAAGPYQNIALIGDIKQLGADIQSEEALRCGYDKSLLERLMNLPDQEYLMLKKNYRHDAQIIRIAWQLFYQRSHNGRQNEIEYMKKGVEIDWSKYPPKEKSIVKNYPVQFFGGTFMDEEKDGSWLCKGEAEQIAKIVLDLRENRGFDADDIGVMAPYRSQVFEIRQQLRAVGQGAINVGTVLDFQGNEKRIIIISNTRASSVYNRYLQQNDDDSLVGGISSFSLMDREARKSSKADYSDMGLTRNPKRFNVAITRARGLVILVGDPRALYHDENVRAFLFTCLSAKTFNGECPRELYQLYQQSTQNVLSHHHAERALNSFGIFAQDSSYESGKLYETMIQR